MADARPRILIEAYAHDGAAGAARMGSLMNSKKVAIVTGGSSGIGAATALALHARGFVVYAAARRVERMAVLERAGVHVVPLDITDESSVAAAVARVLDEQGRIDLLVNNAGYGSYGAFEEVPMDEARRQLEVNVFGLARITQLVLPSMRAARSGRIVNVSSIGGKITTPLGSWYHASKFAVEGLSDALRNELAPFGVDVVVVEPGAIATEWGGIAIASAVETSSHGPYAPLVTAVSNTLGGGGMRPSPATVVADAIVAAAAARRPKTRYVVGANARPALIGRRLLPDRAYDAVLRRMFGVPRRL